MIDTTKRRLFKYLASERIHPSLLLIGPNREEKLQTALAMVQFMLCTEREREEPCGKCSSCQRITRQTHPDVLVFGRSLDADEEEGNEQIKIESVREMTHHMSLSSHEGKAKICIVDEAHRMNTSAQNAFLKTLEEPGEGRYFILLSTQPGRLLPTVLSRCLEFSFKPEVEGRLLSEAERQKYWNLLSDGVRSQSWNDLTDELSEKPDVLQFVRCLQFELREKLVNGKEVPLLKTYTPQEITQIFDGLVEIEGRLRSNANPSLMVENFLDKNFLES